VAAAARAPSKRSIDSLVAWQAIKGAIVPLISTTSEAFHQFDGLTDVAGKIRFLAEQSRTGGEDWLSLSAASVPTHRLPCPAQSYPYLRLGRGFFISATWQAIKQEISRLILSAGPLWVRAVGLRVSIRVNVSYGLLRSRLDLSGGKPSVQRIP
jgi:hypothetical protein